MALIDCPECGTQVSSAAPSCPKCGYPIAEAAQDALGKTEEPKPKKKPTNTGRMLLLVGFLFALAALLSRAGDDEPRTSSPTAPTRDVQEAPRDESRALCRDMVHGLMPKLRKVLGTPTLAVQVGLSDAMSCKGIPEGFSCALEDGPFWLIVSDQDKVRGFRLVFTEEPVQGFAAPGCCDGVAEAAETYRRAKFQRYGRDCYLTFGHFPH